MQKLSYTGAKKKIHSLEKSLSGARYPMEKAQVIELAELNFADGDILDVLYALGDSNYYSLSDVKQEIQYLLHDDRINENNRFFLYYDEEDEYAAVY